MSGAPRGNKPEFSEGDVLGSYRLGAKLGEGGMGVVFLATTEGGGEKFALKIMRSELAADETFRRRFLHEVRAAQAVSNEHLVRVHEAGEFEGRPYLLVEHISGGSLESLIASNGPLSIEQTVQIAGEIAAGLDALHGADVVHRDVKPSNIMLRPDGSAALTDFGLAKGRAYTVLTTPGQVVGTLDYLAPELIRGEPAARASDIYALGCVVCECLSGQPPFGNKGVFQVGMAHLEENPPDPCAEISDAPADLSWAVLRALAKNPEERPRTAKEYSNLISVAARERGL